MELYRSITPQTACFPLACLPISPPSRMLNLCPPKTRKCSIQVSHTFINHNGISKNFTSLRLMRGLRFMSGFPSRRGLSSYCLGTIVSALEVASFSWVSIIDQMLLVTTIVLVFMAGVVPNASTHRRAMKNVIQMFDNDLGADFSGRHADHKSSTFSNNSWVQVEQKLLDALFTVSDDNDSVECIGSKMNYPYSLLALKGSSRFRLLVATLRTVQEEVFNISQLHEGASCDAWQIIFSDTIQGCTQPIFQGWLEGEVSLQKKGHEKELIGRAFGKLGAGGSILQKIILSAKANLYGDLLFYLRFGSHGLHYYDEYIFEQHQIEILEDLVITLADGICTNYLELISLDSSLFSEGNYLGSYLCSLSTRELQKLRNQVALNQWFIQNFESVVSMYEDRFDLFVLRRKLVEKPNVDATSTFNFMKIPFFPKQVSEAYSQYIIFSQFSIFVRRTKELKSLAGWKYYYSLFLELSDIAVPLIKAAFVRVKNAISFFLTCLIGRSLGLIYSGIRQSLGWR